MTGLESAAHPIEPHPCISNLVGADGFEPPWAVKDQQGYSLPVSATHARTQMSKNLAEGWRVERQSPEGATV